MTKFNDSSMFDDFKEETAEYIEQIEKILDALERNKQDFRALENFLIAVHTIKASSAIMGFENINKITSAMEEILELTKSSKKKMSDKVLQVLTDSYDGLKVMFENLERDKIEQNKMIWGELAPVLQDIIENEPMKEPKGEATKRHEFDNSDILGFFIIEAEEYIELFNEKLAQLQESPNDPSVLETLLTTAHTLKGSAAMMELANMSRLARLFEVALKQVKKGELKLEEVSDLLFETVEGFEAMVEQIQSNEIEGHGEILSIFESQYNSLQEDLLKAASPDEEELEEKLEIEEEIEELDEDDIVAIFAKEASRYLKKIRKNADKLVEKEKDEQVLGNLEVTAHTLKGSALTMGFNSLGKLAGEFQKILRLVMEDKTKLDDLTISLLKKCSTDFQEMVKNIVKGNVDQNKLILQEVLPDMEWIVELALQDKQGEKEFRGIPKEEREIPEIAPEIEEYFLVEASEHIQTIDEKLLALEKSPYDADIIRGLFRSLHTLKGSASIAGFVHVSSLAHIMEDVLARVRKKEIAINEELISLLFQGLDNLRRFLELRTPEVFDIIDALTENFRKAVKSAAEAGALPSEIPKFEAKPAEIMVEAPILDIEKQTVRINISELDRLMNLVGELVINRARLDQRISNLMGLSTELETTKHHLISIVKNFHRKYEFSQTTNSTTENEGIAGDFRELEFDKYDDFNILSRSLIDVSSKMTEIMNQLSSFFGGFREETSHISTVTNELQEGITNIRMVSVDRLFRRFQRPVRDLAKAQGKEVDIIFEGGDTVLDKRLVEEIADPLLHIVRNAVYHGIEAPAKRERLGKNRVGKIKLKAHHEGDNIIILIEDDGSGIDGAKIKEIALRKGLISRAEYDSVSVADAVNLIYLPGMSTVEVADDVSGRGVGMDVVMNNINRLNGSIDIETGKGEGTKFIISLPLTLAITKALMLKVQDETFAVNVNSVLEILFIDKKEIKSVSRDEVIILRDKVIPIKRLSNILRIEHKENGSERYPVVIVGTHERSTALLVDELVGREDIVVKPLGEFLGSVNLFSGATISGEGNVRLILDIQSLVGYSIKTAGKVKISVEGGEVEQKRGVAIMGTPKILLVDDSITIRKFVSKLLEKNNFEVETAIDGLDALEKAKEEVFDLFIIDLEMPRMHGYDLITELRSMSAFAQTPIMIMTSRAGEKHRQKAISLGADDYIVKPVTEEVLIESINRLLS